MCQNKRLSIDELIEGVDFNWETVDGVRIRVFSREYLLQVRPQCCKSYCKNCPWDYKKD
jgi:hypothetical protein